MRPQNRHLKRRAAGGRPKGAPNKITREMQGAARRLVEDPGYVASLKKRLIRGKGPRMEILLHYYAYGKPKDQLEVSGSEQRPLSIKVTWGEEPVINRNGPGRPARTKLA